MLLSLALMILVLARLLNNRSDPETTGLRYQVTYKLYLSALFLAFAGFGAALLI